MSIQLYQRNREQFGKVMAKMRKGYNFDYACQTLSLEPDFVIDGIIYNDMVTEWVMSVRKMKEQQRALSKNAEKSASPWPYEVNERKIQALDRIKAAVSLKKDSINAVMDCFENSSSNLAECASAHGFELADYRVLMFSSPELTSRFRAVIDKRTAATNEQLRESYTTLVPKALQVIQDRLSGKDVKRRVQQTTKKIPIQGSNGEVITYSEEVTNVAEEQTVLPTAGDVKIAMQIAGVLPGASLAAQNVNSGEGGISDLDLQKLQEAFGIAPETQNEEDQDGEL